MTFSQKIARVFEVVGYILLAPAAYGFLIATLCVLWIPALTFIVWAITAPGIILLVGYFKHSRGRLPERKVKMLWFGTILYNCVPLFFLAYQLYTNYASSEFQHKYHPSSDGSLFLFVALAWWTTAIIAPACALYKNYKDAETYL